MAPTHWSVATLLPFLILYIVAVEFVSRASASSFGINYGLDADNLPSPAAVPPILRSIGVSHVRLYDADPTVLRAFASTGVDFTIGVPNNCVQKFAADTSAAVTWAKANVVPYLPATNISSVAVGNEALTSNDTSPAALAPAMRNLRSALASLGLDGQVAVVSAHSLVILANSYPPSAANFRPDILPAVSDVLAFCAETGAPFYINAYPYFAYKADPNGVPLDYVLFQKNPGVVDVRSGLTYTNMLHAQVDAVYAAIDAAMGKDKAKAVTVRVSETGWPSAGDADEAGATPENAARYNDNLAKLVDSRKGTPRRPDVPLEVYVFALFNENLKPGPTSERNYGLFKADGTPVYKLMGSGGSGGGGDGSTIGGGNTVGQGGGGGGGGGAGNWGYNSMPGYYGYSLATKLDCHSLVFQMVLLVWTTYIA